MVGRTRFFSANQPPESRAQIALRVRSRLRKLPRPSALNARRLRSRRPTVEFRAAAFHARELPGDMNSPHPSGRSTSAGTCIMSISTRFGGRLPRNPGAREVGAGSNTPHLRASRAQHAAGRPHRDLSEAHLPETGRIATQAAPTIIKTKRIATEADPISAHASPVRY